MSDADDADDKGRPRKAPTAFRTISEVADDLNIPQHVLRFWESQYRRTSLRCYFNYCLRCTGPGGSVTRSFQLPAFIHQVTRVLIWF